MKKLFFYIIATAVLLTACHNEKDSPQMTLTVAKPQVELNMQALGKLSIDWGDGTKDDVFEITSYSSKYTHKYSDTSFHTITIIGKNITYLCCNENQIIEIDISKYPKLKELVCRINKLTKLDVSKNTELEQLICGNNQLADLDVSKNAKLKWLLCGNNQLMCLDVGKNEALEYLDCNENLLTDLDVSRNVLIEELDCAGNNFSAEALNSLFETLCKTNRKNRNIFIYGNPGADSCDKSIVENKGWYIYSIKTR